ncbi:hypothetical protein HU200_063644 [Digitaria exilis]|uniref:Methyltransferase domain-containing protein n=1 Tax=Digitaria exilis TaxID=1010633 RepID=A0A835A6U1_9POAL|nr:hypothetical protein HU200_063644 [Digitaria exilis]
MATNPPSPLPPNSSHAFRSAAAAADDDHAHHRRWLPPPQTKTSLRPPPPATSTPPTGSSNVTTAAASRRDERFGKEEHYEWFKDFSHFRHLLAPLLSPSLSVRASPPLPTRRPAPAPPSPKSCRAVPFSSAFYFVSFLFKVLEVGCGNSRLGEELLREGVAGGITCVDLSPVAVQRMRDRLAAQGTKGVDAVVADMLDLPFEPESFDLVIEKGTMGKRSLESNSYQNTLPAAPRINMVHEELENEDFIFRTNVDEL